MRLVLDTSVIVAGIRSEAGASRVLLEAAFRRRYTLLLGVPLVLEYEAVLTRPEHLRRSGLSRAQMSELLDELVRVGEAVRLSFRWRPALPDASDDMVLEAALNGGANAIVTANERDFRECGRFGLGVLTPRACVKEIERYEEK